MTMIQIQATFSGYGGKACSLFSAYDPASRVLAVIKEADYRVERREGCIVLTNIPDIARDALFTEASLMGAIQAFYTLKSGVAKDGRSSRLVFADHASRANPDQCIDRDGIDATGPKYRISDTMTCAQVACLATCLHATRADTVERAVSMADQLTRLMSGGILTVGDEDAVSDENPWGGGIKWGV